MAETPGSLRAVFLIMGAGSAIVNGIAIGSEIVAVRVAAILIGLPIAVAFLAAGIRIGSQLANGAKSITDMLAVVAVLAVVEIAVVVATVSTDEPSLLVAPGIGFLIALYLRASVKRLSRGEAGRSER